MWTWEALPPHPLGTALLLPGSSLSSLTSITYTKGILISFSWPLCSWGNFLAGRDDQAIPQPGFWLLLRALPALGCCWLAFSSPWLTLMACVPHLRSQTLGERVWIVSSLKELEWRKTVTGGPSYVLCHLTLQLSPPEWLLDKPEVGWGGSQQGILIFLQRG